MIWLSLVLIWVLGLGVIRFFFPAPAKCLLHNALVISLGAGVGIGIASSLYFLCLATFGPKVAIIAAVEGVALAAAVVLAAVAKRRKTLLDWAPGPPSPWYLRAAFGVTLLTALAMFIFYALTKPHGEWDAWSIWNLRARFLFRAGDFWKDAFSSQLAWSHPGYPLLLPGVIALCWTLARNESTLAPAAIALLFTFGMASSLIATVGILRGKTQALIAGTVLLGGVGLVVNGANQYADVPLGYFILATLALVCLQERHPEDLRFTVLAGLTAGFAAWTKNEGLLFLVAVVAARGWAIGRYGNRSALLPQLLRMAAGFVAPLALVGFFKLRFAASDDLLSKRPGQIVENVANIGRWITVLEAYVKAPFRMGNFIIPIILVLALYWYLVRFKVEERDRPGLATILGTLAITLAGEFAIYLAFPGDVAWQLNTSLERLLLQLWPAGLLAFFLAANAPQLAGISKAAAKSKPVKRTQKPARRTAEAR